MRVLILGGTGRIGRLAVAAAVSSGHEVTAMARHPWSDPSVTFVVGDVRDPGALSRALASIDAVIAAVGPRSNTVEEELALEMGMRNLVAAAKASGLRRIVALSGAGVDVPDDRKPLLDRAASWFIRRAAEHVVGAKQREYEVLATSGLAWTALRPPLVTDGPARGYRLDFQLRPGARVTREDVGRALVDQLVDETFVQRAPFVLPR